jgi:hypothetical protein
MARSDTEHRGLTTSTGAWNVYFVKNGEFQSRTGKGRLISSVYFWVRSAAVSYMRIVNLPKITAARTLLEHPIPRSSSTSIRAGKNCEPKGCIP